jgi:hypothetical protein
MCAYTQLGAHISSYMHICISSYVHIYIQLHVHIPSCVHKYPATYAYTSSCMCMYPATCPYTQPCAQIPSHICIYIQLHPLSTFVLVPLFHCVDIQLLPRTVTWHWDYGCSVSHTVKGSVAGTGGSWEVEER